MALLDEIIARREEVLSLAKKYGLKDIRIFGSVARREETPESDIDFLVNLDLPNYKDSWGYVKFKMDAEELFNRKVDLVSESGLYHMLRESVLQEAKPV